MIFAREIENYLTGKEFSNGINVKVAEKQSSIPNRLEYLESLARKKNIIHVGFADHMPLIPKKIQNNTWLHKRIMESANSCVGIDIDQETVHYVKNELGIDGVYALDITDRSALPEAVTSKKWDYLILGEVLEHIDNPVHFLANIAANFKGIADRLVITVPNAWDVVNFRALRKHNECINTDHRFWFTPYTLAKVGTRAGLRVEEFKLVMNYTPGIWWKKILLKRYPMMRETVLMVFEI